MRPPQSVVKKQQQSNNSPNTRGIQSSAIEYPEKPRWQNTMQYLKVYTLNPIYSHGSDTISTSTPQFIEAIKYSRMTRAHQSPLQDALH